MLTLIHYTHLHFQYFSESGKLVMKMFEHLSELADDENCFVCILIDEVESIASARHAAHNNNEPGQYRVRRR